MIKIKTSRFNTIELRKEDLLFFPEGLIGFSELRNFLFIDDPFDHIFIWLQSFEIPDVAFPVLQPSLFDLDYEVKLSKNDLNVLSLEKNDPYQYFSITAVPEDPSQMTVNLKAPVVLNTKFKKGKQCVLQDPNLLASTVSMPIFSKIRNQIIKEPSFSFKIQTQPQSKNQKPSVIPIQKLSSIYKKRSKKEQLCPLNEKSIFIGEERKSKDTFSTLKEEKNKIKTTTEVEI